LKNLIEIKCGPMTAQRKSRPATPRAPAEGGRLARIEAALDAADAAWVRGLVEAIDPRGQRDEAIRSAAALLGPAAPSARAKAVEAELRRYLGSGWLRERQLPSPPVGASGIREQLFYIARLTAGDGLGWRRLVKIIEA
jgi:hypothetical protein